ncbi:MAG: hypothetical protein QW594_04355 [Candidatus Woesearchaeota archaeon]
MKSIQSLSHAEKKEAKYILARVVLEVLGRPKEHVEETRDKLLQQLKEHPQLHVVEEYIAEPKEEEDELFSSFLELGIWFDSPKTLLDFAMLYLPSHIELLEPDAMSMPLHQANELFNDLALKLHTLNKAYQETLFENKELASTLQVVVKNAVIVALSKRPMRLEQLSKLVGVEQEGLSKIVEQLIKENYVIKKAEPKSVENPPSFLYSLNVERLQKEQADPAQQTQQKQPQENEEDNKK